MVYVFYEYEVLKNSYSLKDNNEDIQFLVWNTIFRIVYLIENIKFISLSRISMGLKVLLDRIRKVKLL